MDYYICDSFYIATLIDVTKTFAITIMKITIMSCLFLSIQQLNELLEPFHLTYSLS